MVSVNGRYIRNIPALSENECLSLQTKKVFIAGCGGLGGHLIELMARIGVGHIKAIDGDVFEMSNLNRQLLSSTALLGTSKADAALARIKSINPSIQAETETVFLDASNAARLIEGYDLVLDALDNIEARRVLANACAQQNIPYIYGAINGWVAQAAISLPGDHLMDKLYPAGVRLTDKSVLAFAPAMCASMQASLAVKLMTKRPVETSKLYYFDLQEMELEVIPL